MTVVVPRLDRAVATELIRHRIGADIGAIQEAMPDLEVGVTYPPVGAGRISEPELQRLRHAIVDLAGEHGMPGPLVRSAEFDGRAARLLHELLPLTPHEASHEEVWSYLTCCWLLDVAVWRFGTSADERRFIGNVNRNTFRRLWWRAEVLGPDIRLNGLGEDELVAIMERSTIAADVRLARTIASTFLSRLEEHGTHDRMMLMREAMKRMLRLTPFVAFSALDDAELQLLVADVFDAAAAGLAGEQYSAPTRPAREVGPPGPEVIAIPRLSMEAIEEPVTVDDAPPDDFETVAQVAIDIARRTGRVTNITLREVAAISPEEARAVFKALMERGDLVRRGVKRGTHYVVPDPDVGPPASVTPPKGPISPPPTDLPARDSALRRLLRRGR